jgi:hypothetical protein
MQVENRNQIRVIAGCRPMIIQLRNFNNKNYLNCKGEIVPVLCYEDTWGSGGVAPPFLASSLDGGEQSASRPFRFIPGGKSPLVPRAGFRLDEALSYLRYGALYKSRYSMSVTNTIFGYLEG